MCSLRKPFFKYGLLHSDSLVMSKKGISLTTQVIILVSVLLLAINVILGVFLIIGSRAAMMELVSARMLDISNTAAVIVNGDIFENLTVEDKNNNTTEYQKIYNVLNDYQENIECDYIYSIKKVGEKSYVYVVDPDPEEPAEFGDEFDYLPVLDTAYLGTPSIDEAATEDEWGRCYSSFSPIRNGSGEIVGIIGVDFNKEWVDEKVAQNSSTVIISIVFSLVIGVIMVLLFTAGIRGKFDKINGELSALSVGLDELTQKISEDEHYTPIEPLPEKDEGKTKKTDEIGAIGARLHSMQTALGNYIEYMNVKAYTDRLTGARNSTAYYNFCDILNRKIKEGVADFAILVFDLNGLKCVNDEHGHIVGDRYIIGAMSVMAKVLGKDKIYRLGGDEFVCLIEGIGEEEVLKIFARLDEESVKFNAANDTDFGREVWFSKGFAIFDPKTDKDLKDVFRRADFAMYADKKEYYTKHPKN